MSAPANAALPWQYDDGGRADAGFKGSAGDCVCRALTIAAGESYQAVYDILAEGNATQRRSRRSRARGRRSARDGINTGRKWFHGLMRSRGFKWTPAMAIGTGCKHHLRTGEVPANCIAVVSKHWVAVVDGVMRDTHDPSRGGTRCVYGWWAL